MNRRNMTLIAALAVTGAALTLTGCKEDGPATKAGKALDNAAAKAGEKTGEAMKDTGAAMNKAGDAVKDAAKKP